MRANYALLFDLDGTLLDTDALHIGAYNELLSRWERSVTLDYYKTQVMGFPNDDIMQRLFPDATRSERTALADRKEELFRSRLSHLEPTRGVLRLLDWAEERHYSMAVVTNAPPANAARMLDGLGISARFQEIIIGETLPHGKPHPLPYQTALARLGVPPWRAIAFEDSASGVKSASDAGIFTVGLTTSLDAQALRSCGARETIRDFDDPRIWEWLPADRPAYVLQDGHHELGR